MKILSLSNNFSCQHSVPQVLLYQRLAPLLVRVQTTLCCTFLCYIYQLYFNMFFAIL
jgi:hypothetical protein